MLSIEQVIALDNSSNPDKLLPTTIRFLKDMRAIVNFGRTREGKKPLVWTEADESRF